jgi:hypothetical protein
MVVVKKETKEQSARINELTTTLTIIVAAAAAAETEITAAPATTTTTTITTACPLPPSCPKDQLTVPIQYH